MEEHNTPVTNTPVTDGRLAYQVHCPHCFYDCLLLERGPCPKCGIPLIRHMQMFGAKKFYLATDHLILYLKKMQVGSSFEVRRPSQRADERGRITKTESVYKLNDKEMTEQEIIDEHWVV